MALYPDRFASGLPQVCFRVGSVGTAKTMFRPRKSLLPHINQEVFLIDWAGQPDALWYGLS